MIVKYSIVALYFLVLIVLGAMASRRVRTLEDYYVGGKKLGYWVVAFSTRATGESAWLLLGLTGLGAFAGYSAFWVVLGEVLGVSVAWFLMAKPFKRLTDQYQSITVPDYLHSHFNARSTTLRAVAAGALTVFVIIYISAQIDATGSAFESFLGWNYYLGALVGFIIVVVYILYGGFVAVAWSDVFQGSLMFLGLVLLPIYMILHIGSWEAVGTKLHQIDPALTNIFGTGGFNTYNLFTIIGYAVIGLGFMGSPQVFVRFMSIKDQSEITKGRWVALIFTLLTDTAAVCIGIFGRYLFTESGTDVQGVLGNGAQNVLPMSVEGLLPLVLEATYIAVVLAAIMSTIDSLLVVGSSAITHDFDQKIFRRPRKDLARHSRNVTLGMAMVALLIALTVSVLSPTRTIFWFVIFGWSGIAATFCPVIILSLLWKEYNESGALASMITGFLSVPLFKFGATNLPGVGVYFNQVAELMPSFVLAILVGVLVTKFTNR